MLVPPPLGDRPDTVVMPDGRLSAVRLEERAVAVAARLRGATMAAVDARASVDTVVAVLAGLRAGVPVVPLLPDAGPAERAYCLRDSGADCWLGPSPPDDDGGLPVVPLQAGPEAGSGSARAPDASRPALVMYTSGTTGRPKGVVLSAAALAADLDGLADAWQWSPDDVLVHGLPLCHVHGLVLGVLGALRVGCRLVHTGRPTPEAYAGQDGTLYFGVPTVWSRVAADPGAARALRRARLLVSGSAPLPARVCAALGDLAGHRPVERYGMTETLITLAARADAPSRPGSVGWPLPGVEARLADDGELLVRGPTLFSGYLGRPDVTAAAYDDGGWFRTGDALTQDADGWYRVVGRIGTDLIKTGGYRVGSGEVEDALLEHGGVREAAVVGLPDDDLGQVVVGFVLADGVTGPELVDFTAGHLAAHKRPRRVHVVEELPRTALGKVRKTDLVEP